MRLKKESLQGFEMVTWDQFAQRMLKRNLPNLSTPRLAFEENYSPILFL